jgi:hypothetical protein
MDQRLVLTLDDTPRNADVLANVPRCTDWITSDQGAGLPGASRGAQLVLKPHCPIRVLKPS